MASITNIAFDVKFNMTGVPTLVLTDKTVTPPVGFAGAFSVVMPDGYVRTGNILSPDISAGGSWSIPCRFDNEGNVQRGEYTIRLTCSAPGFDDTIFTRTFFYSYKPVDLQIRTDFDVFSPRLRCFDDTVYQVGGFDSSGLVRSWNVTSVPTGVLTSSASSIDLIYLTNYYDAYYAIVLTATINYVSQTYAWLTVDEIVSKTLNTYAQTPPVIRELVETISELKLAYDESINKCAVRDDLRQDFEFAQSILGHIVDKIRTGDLENIYADLTDLLRVLSNNQIPAYTPTNLPIPPYDLTSYFPGAAWGNIVGVITSQTDLVAYITTQITNGKYAANIGNASATSIIAVHGLGSLDVQVELFKNSTGETVYADVRRSGVNEVTVSFAAAPSLNQYRIIITR